MSAIDDMLEANAEYAQTFHRGDLPIRPARRLAIVTCMDSRIFPSRAFGLKQGDAHIIRNAGGRAKEALRSLIISERFMETNEIVVIHHTDCGSIRFSNEQIQAKVKSDLGADASHIDFLPFSDLEESVREDVSFLLSCPLIPTNVVVRGFIFDVHTGKLNEVQFEAALERQ
jgi:carbonic anhydrase